MDENRPFSSIIFNLRIDTTAVFHSIHVYYIRLHSITFEYAKSATTPQQKKKHMISICFSAENGDDTASFKHFSTGPMELRK